MQQKVDGKFRLVTGQTRSGKTQYTLAAIKKAIRVIVYDADDQYSQLPGFVRVTDPVELFARVKTPGAEKLAFVPAFVGKESFEYWCQVALYWGKWYGGCTAIAEELASVSPPGKALKHWGNLVRRGKKRGIDVFAITQFPGESDKTITRSLDEIICFRMSRPADREYMADMIGCDSAYIPDKDLNYIKKVQGEDGFSRHKQKLTQFRT